MRDGDGGKEGGFGAGGVDGSCLRRYRPDAWSSVVDQRWPVASFARRDRSMVASAMSVSTESDSAPQYDREQRIEIQNVSGLLDRSPSRSFAKPPRGPLAPIDQPSMMIERH